MTIGVEFNVMELFVFISSLFSSSYFSSIIAKLFAFLAFVYYDYYLAF